VCNHERHPDLTFAEAFKLTGRERECQRRTACACNSVSRAHAT
jgi:hypothetical protein